MRRKAARLVTQSGSTRKPGTRSAKFCLAGVLLALGVGVFLSVRSVMPPPPVSSEKAPATRDASHGERTLKKVKKEAAPGRGFTPAPGNKLREESQEDALKKAAQNQPIKSPPEEEILTTEAGKFSKADTVIGVLMAHKVRRSEIQKVLDSVRNKRIFSRIRAGRRYEVRKSNKDGEFREFVFQLNNNSRLRIWRTPSGTMTAKKEAIPYSIDVVRIQSRIDSSLYKAIADSGGSPVLVYKLSEIFAYVIDFHKDLKSGDEVEVLVERKHLRDEFTGYGKILAAEFIVGDRRHTAVYFKHAGGKYYNFEGESLRRAFLRSPLRYTRISSRFSKRRFHPLLKRYRPHFGVDYAAPRGTPVHAVADGVVAWAGRKHQAGKTIELRHGGGYRTAYLHLYRYARGIRAGRRVVQGDVIGYVGSTGLSTGPHLDYRITRRGRYLDPLKAELPKGMPLPSSLRPAFKRILDELRTMFDNIPLLKEVRASPAAHETFFGAAEKRTSRL